MIGVAGRRRRLRWAAALGGLALAASMAFVSAPAVSAEEGERVNLAPRADATASFTSGHSSTSFLNDGDLAAGEWAAWPQVGEIRVDLQWESAVRLDGAAVQFAADAPDDASVGLIPPRSWRLQYRSGSGWADVQTSDGYSRERDTLNTVSFEPVTTDALRLVMQSWGTNEGGGSPAIREFEAFGTMVPVEVPQPPFPNPAAGETGCRTVSDHFPWGELAMRTWTPNAAGVQPFQARLVQAYSRDAVVSAERVVLEDSAGCRTIYAANEFGADDRAYVSSVRADNPPAVDPATYVTAYDDNLVGRDDIDSGNTRLFETQHFAIFYGTNTDAFSYTYQAGRGVTWQQGIDDLARWMEESWTMIRDVTEAEMPYANVEDKRKINIYICGTGLPWFEDTGDCGAAASGGGMWVSSVYTLDGSSTMTHELGHVIQGLSGGFSGGGVPGAGNIWEGHANWLSASTGGMINVWYYQNLENGPTWTVSNYGFFPLLLQIDNDDRTRGNAWRMWHENLRDDNGGTREEYLETLVRLGREDGVYPLGFASFADDLGWYGARLAANDFQQGRDFRDTMQWGQEASRFVGLVPNGSVGGFDSSPDRPLWQFGSHLIPLDVDGGTASVTLAGEATKDTAAWRYALVSVGPDGRPRYSALGADDVAREGTTVTLETSQPGSYYLAVTATPYDLEHIGGEVDPQNRTLFPYQVELEGARPSLPGTGTCLNPLTTGGAANLNWQTNGKFTWDQACATVGPRVRIDTQPVDAAVTADAPASFSVAASGAEAYSLQWQTAQPGATEWQDVAGATGGELVLTPGQPDGLRVRAVVTGESDTVVASRTASLAVSPPAATPDPLTPDEVDTIALSDLRITVADGVVTAWLDTTSRGSWWAGEIHPAAESLGWAAAGDSNSVAYTLPKDLTPGRHWLVLRPVSGEPLRGEFEIDATPPTTEPSAQPSTPPRTSDGPTRGGLAATGASGEAGLVALLGALLVGAGVVAARRRQPQTGRTEHD